MPTDLTNVYDHPAVILEEDCYPVVAGRLRYYEITHGVTFAALDNEALQDVRAAYEQLAATSLDPAEIIWAAQELKRTIACLLGLED